MARGDQLDLELQGLVAISLAMGVSLTFWSAAFLESQAALFGAGASLGLLLSAASVAALFSRRAFDLMLALWSTTLVLASFCAVRVTSWSVVALPALVLLLGLSRRRALTLRLGGDSTLDGYRPSPGLDTSRCEFCGEPAQGVVSPRLVISALVLGVSSWTTFRVVCPRHAAIRAIVPTLVTALLGWWSLPGLVWTPMALIDNVLRGGVHATDDMVREMEEDHRLGWRAWLPAVAGVAGGLVAFVEASALFGAIQALLAA